MFINFLKYLKMKFIHYTNTVHDPHPHYLCDYDLPFKFLGICHGLTGLYIYMKWTIPISSLLECSPVTEWAGLLSAGASLLRFLWYRLYHSFLPSSYQAKRLFSFWLEFIISNSSSHRAWSLARISLPFPPPFISSCQSVDEFHDPFMYFTIVSI